MRRYFEGDYVAAAYIAMPQIERLAREEVLMRNQPAYRAQRGNAPGQYAGLGTLISILDESDFDESWSRFIRTMFYGPMGTNLRNELLHGFVSSDTENWSSDDIENWSPIS